MSYPATATPRALSRSSSCSSFDDSYFYQNYVPLSNLPTPPLVYSNSTTRRPSSEQLLPDDSLAPTLRGPAIHLTNLIPSSTSLITPSTTSVHAILARAALPTEMLALAACILDSLNSRFALSWRLGCPLNTPSTSSPPLEPHIDTIPPELPVLAALILSSQFLDDHAYRTHTLAADWGAGVWSNAQVNFTLRCVLDNIGYSLLPLCEDSIIRDSLRDMERAARRSDIVIYDGAKAGDATGSTERKGEAVTGAREQPTQAETPMVDMTFMDLISPLERVAGEFGSYNVGSYSV